MLFIIFHLLSLLQCLSSSFVLQTKLNRLADEMPSYLIFNEMGIFIMYLEANMVIVLHSRVWNIIICIFLWSIKVEKNILKLIWKIGKYYKYLFKVVIASMRQLVRLKEGKTAKINDIPGFLAQCIASKVTCINIHNL